MKIVLPVLFVIIVIAGYIIAKKRNIRLKWWFPLAVLAFLCVIALIVTLLIDAFTDIF